MAAALDGLDALVFTGGVGENSERVRAEVCRRLRERPEWRHIKVIMLSAKGRDAEVSKGLATGADLYVTKPFSTRDLIAKINELLGVRT